MVSKLLLTLPGYKYFKVRREKENYRIFSDQQQRSGSVSSRAGTVENESPMGIAYENPIFSSDENNSIQLSAIGGSGSVGSSGSNAANHDRSPGYNIF